MSFQKNTVGIEIEVSYRFVSRKSGLRVSSLRKLTKKYDDFKPTVDLVYLNLFLVRTFRLVSIATTNFCAYKFSVLSKSALNSDVICAPENQFH